MGAEIGMLVVETIAKVRREYFRSRSAVISVFPRKVVRKVIRSEATEFRYEREAQPLPRISASGAINLDVPLPDMGKSPGLAPLPRLVHLNLIGTAGSA